MHIVEPKVFVIAETRTCEKGWREMLSAVGAPSWDPGPSTQAERLIEAAGRLCYRSFEVGLNTNVTRVRSGNKEYIENILKQRHGSVLEHASVSVALIGVSRILTHELVRHRPGMAYSQESMRFVRLDDIGMYVPDLVPTLELIEDKNENNSSSNFQRAFEGFMREITELAERRIATLAAILDQPGISFHIKKTITSALRRMAPGGHTTNIIATGNHRAWRHTIENRTAPGAEVEIVQVFGEVAKQFGELYPAIYQDMFSEVHDDDPSLSHFRFKYQKV